MSKHDKFYERTYRLRCLGKFNDGDGGHTTTGLVEVSKINFVNFSDDIPNWRQLLAMGKDATTDMAGYRTSFLPQIYTGSYQGRPSAGIPEEWGGAWQGHNTQSLLNLPTPTLTPSPLAYNKAATNLLGSYLTVRNTWRGGNFIAEFGETVETLAHPLKSLYSSTWSFVGDVGRIKGVYRKNPVRYGRLLGGLWLAYAFGVRPLFEDIKDAQQALRVLSEGRDRDHDTKRIRGTGKIETQLAYTPRLSIGSPPDMGNYWLVDELVRLEESVRFTGAVVARPPGFREIAEEFGVGFYDIIPAVWEAIPWSWLVDYFLNVQEALDSYRLAEANFAWLVRTVKNSAVVDHSEPYGLDTVVDPDHLGVDVTIKGKRQRARTSGVTRTRITSPPYASFQFRVPGIGSQKWCNVAALVAQIEGSSPVARSQIPPIWPFGWRQGGHGPIKGGPIHAPDFGTG